LKEEGLVGLTRGMSPDVLHSDYFYALGYFAFETVKIAILNEHVKRKEFEDAVVSSSS
jgi:solute carrier family 25 (mitochondrial S-adenosylmethionine transporter), member 26